MKWEFTPDEFIYIWGKIGSDRYPAPLSLLASVRWRGEWEAIERNIDERIPVLRDPDLLPVLRTAANPEAALVLVGERKRPLRVYGAVTGNIGVTLVQRPGPDPAFGANVVIEVGSPALVAKICAAVAGQCQAGRTQEMVETYARLQQPSEFQTRNHDRSRLADRMRQLLAAPRTGHGHLEILHGRHEPRPASGRYLSWFDVEDDGRYLYQRRYDDFHLSPCAPDGLRQAITQIMEPTY
ncbi:ESX secretion-associated protein EspG [Nocardia callitridis]|uniref:ESX secretion-associated protein EspG n=1 Tax=Nocardia callitridis TaxID=648753 RepID=A0ABP9KS68_9NOCA